MWFPWVTLTLDPQRQSTRMWLPWVTLTLVLALTFSPHVAHAFDTDWDQPFLMECPLGQVLKSIYSVHSNKTEDRRWRFGCSVGPNGCNVRSCRWTGYVNEWDAPMNFLCPANYVITGLQSYHSNKKEDRRFKFRCCTHYGYVTSSCSLTGYINGWDGVLSYRVPPGQVLAGWAGIHNNGKEDRLYQFFVCRYGKK